MNKKIKYLKKTPEIGQIYYILTAEGVINHTWHGTEDELYLLHACRLFADKKEAERANKFIKNYIQTHPKKFKYITDMPEIGSRVWYGIYMTGDCADCQFYPYFNPKNTTQMRYLEDYRLYRTLEDLEAAINLITNLLIKNSE